MRGTRLIRQVIAGLALSPCLAGAQTEGAVDVKMRVVYSKHSAGHVLPPAILWLVPVGQTPPSPFVPLHHYTLVQKNRSFKPHLLVIPVGSSVDFPNRDPFYLNVFSLFDGKRFDLGLYEAGSTKTVAFSREGVSYIFCNIHPEMSAVVISLSTRLYAIADTNGSFHVEHVPPGEYEAHAWIEGVSQPLLNGLTRRVHVSADLSDLGVIEAPPVLLKPGQHSNMYGQQYDRDTKPTY